MESLEYPPYREYEFLIGKWLIDVRGAAEEPAESVVIFVHASGQEDDWHSFDPEDGFLACRGGQSHPLKAKRHP